MKPKMPKEMMAKFGKKPGKGGKPMMPPAPAGKPFKKGGKVKGGC